MASLRPRIGLADSQRGERDCISASFHTISLGAEIVAICIEPTIIREIISLDSCIVLPPNIPFAFWEPRFVPDVAACDGKDPIELFYVSMPTDDVEPPERL
jgi:hypothetical protein